MKNSYLTSRNMDMLQRVLTEASGSRVVDTADEGRFLIECFERGMTEEKSLGQALADRRKIADASPLGNVGMLSKLYRILARHRDEARSIPSARLTVPLNEAARRITNDTVGEHRRSQELQARHAMQH